jgi:extracellular solute-binding protein (family 5)
MRLLRRSVAGFGFVACLGAVTWGCGSRTVPPAVPAPPTAPIPATVRPPTGTVPPQLPTPEIPPNASPVTSPATVVSAAQCALVAGPGDPIATIGLAERVDPANAPHPSNDSERLLFRQVYETLVRVDCEGQVRAGLAASWRFDQLARAWTITLRDNARFTDGALVTAADVRSGWAVDGVSTALRPQVRRYVRSVTVVDERTLTIALETDSAEALRTLADTNLAVVKRSPASRWPMGTRGARVEPDQALPDARGRLVLTITGLAPGSTAAGDRPWSFRFIVAPDRDPRDLLDEGVDLLLTREPAALDYAAALPQFQSAPLTWQRTHVFASPWRGRSLPGLPEDGRQALAAGAVRGEARGAEGPFWWQTLSDCEVPHPKPRELPLPASGRIVYERGDNASRDLAERLVGLAGVAAGAPTLGTLLPGPPRQIFQRAAALSGQELTTTQQRGTDVAYILTFDSRPLDPCQAWRAAADRIGWLDPEAIVPLVDTRLRAVIRRGRSNVTTEWDGGLLIAPSAER